MSAEPPPPVPPRTGGDDEYADDNEAVDYEQDEYFRQYANLSVHAEMLSDSARNEAYAAALTRCCAGKVVMDVGSGTGFLAILAAVWGAKQVIAVEASELARLIPLAAARNGVADRVCVVHATVESMEALPGGVDAVDVLVSEWMGTCLFFEGMVASVLHARDRWLRPDGVMLPTTARLYLAPTSVPLQDRVRQQWKERVCGVDLSTFHPLANEQLFCRQIITSEVVNAADLLCDATKLCETNLKTVSSGELFPLVAAFSFADVTKGGTARSMTGFAMWWEVDFLIPLVDDNDPDDEDDDDADLDVDVDADDSAARHQPDNLSAVVISTLSTSPFVEATHWTQDLFMLPEPIRLLAAEKTHADGCVSERAPELQGGGKLENACSSRVPHNQRCLTGSIDIRPVQRRPRHLAIRVEFECGGHAHVMQLTK